MEGSRIAWDRKTTASLPLALLYFSLFRTWWSVITALSSPCCHSVPCWQTCSSTHLNLTPFMMTHDARKSNNTCVLFPPRPHLLHTPRFITTPQYQQPPHPTPGPTSFPYKLLLPWQLPERGHYLGDIGDRLRKAGAGPSALHQRTSGFRREHCACLLHMHSVNQLFCEPERNNLL